MHKQSVTFFVCLITMLLGNNASSQSHYRSQKNIDDLKRQIDSLSDELQQLEQQSFNSISPDLWLKLKPFKGVLPPSGQAIPPPFEFQDSNGFDLEDLNRLFPEQAKPEGQIPGFNLPDIQKPDLKFFDRNFLYPNQPAPNMPWELPAPPNPNQSIPNFQNWRIQLLKNICLRT